MVTIDFFEEDIEYRLKLKNKTKIRAWLTRAVRLEGKQIQVVNYIFCSDDFLRDLNIRHLQHDAYTDIITFDYSDRTHKVKGDCFISIDRVKDNAKSFEVTEAEEVHRMLIHGILHLCGYLDKKEGEKKIMTEKENYYLKIAANDFDVYRYYGRI